MPEFFYSTGMYCRKIPAGGTNPDRAGRGVLSFGYFSLHKQRKVTRSEGVKALDFKAFDLAFNCF